MHMIIRNIVYATSKQEALDKAEGNMYYMIGDDGNAPFDYYTTFNTGASSYWGDKYKPVSTIKSKEGRKLVCDGWKSTLEEMRRHVKSVKKHFTGKSPIDFLASNDLQHHLSQLGEYRGSSCWLYDDDGEGIKRRKHLNNVLSKWDEMYKVKGEVNPHKNDSIFVVPADVHF